MIIRNLMSFSLVFCSSIAVAAPLAKFIKNTHPNAPERAHVISCEVYEDKITISDTQGGIGATATKAYQVEGATKLRDLFQRVLSLDPKPFKARKPTDELTRLEVYPDPNGEGISIYSVRQREVISHEFIVPAQNNGSAVGPYFSMVFEQIHALCKNFGGLDIGGTEWPGGGA